MYTTEVLLDDQEFADGKGAGVGSSQATGQPQQRPNPSNAIGDGFVNIPDGVEDEGLPFN